MAETVIKGSCLCGAVQYEVADDDTHPIYTEKGMAPVLIDCHCPTCRKQRGTGFSTVAPVPREKLRFLSGESVIRVYESSPGVKRTFCETCGSGLYKLMEDMMPDVIFLHAGTMDGDPGRRVAAHLFVGMKAPWDEITDDKPQMQGFT